MRTGRRIDDKKGERSRRERKDKQGRRGHSFWLELVSCVSTFSSFLFLTFHPIPFPLEFLLFFFLVSPLPFSLLPVISLSFSPIFSLPIRLEMC